MTSKDDQINGLNKNLTLVTAQDKLLKSLPEGLTDKQKTFIGKKFTPDKMEDLEEPNIKEFIDNSLKEYSDYASMFGAEESAGEDDNKFTPDPSNEMDEIDKIVKEVKEQPKGE